MCRSSSTKVLHCLTQANRRKIQEDEKFREQIEENTPVYGVTCLLERREKEVRLRASKQNKRTRPEAKKIVRQEPAFKRKRVMGKPSLADSPERNALGTFYLAVLRWCYLVRMYPRTGKTKRGGPSAGHGRTRPEHVRCRFVFKRHRWHRLAVWSHHISPQPPGRWQRWCLGCPERVVDEKSQSHSTSEVEKN